jgi:hypothetical protein
VKRAGQTLNRSIPRQAELEEGDQEEPRKSSQWTLCLQRGFGHGGGRPVSNCLKLSQSDGRQNLSEDGIERPEFIPVSYNFIGPSLKLSLIDLHWRSVGSGVMQSLGPRH